MNMQEPRNNMTRRRLLGNIAALAASAASCSFLSSASTSASARAHPLQMILPVLSRRSLLMIVIG